MTGGKGAAVPARWVFGILLVFGVARALALAWVCDDSFISFRYAENLVKGNGLVYNAGERVEGYTNLLWTLLVAAWMRFGISPLVAAQAMGVACYIGLALVLSRWSATQSPRPDATFLPLAAAVTLVSNDFQVWATGGLETMLFTLLAVAAVLLTRNGSSSPWPPLLAGLLFGLLTLTRPDGALFAAAGIVSYWFPRGRLGGARAARASLLALAPLLAVGAGLVAFKLLYYGELLPTAFYAKSAARPFYSQGALYLGLYLAKNWYLAPAAAALFAASRLIGSGTETRSSSTPFLLAVAGLFCVYVVYTGGDFMFARRLIPAVPFLLLVLEERVRALPRRAWRVGASIAVVAAAAAPYPLYSDERTRIAGIADEPRFYPPATIEARKAQARFVGSALAGTGARVMFEGGMCVFGFYSGLPYLVEMTGLTQYSLARLPLGARGTVGHEKRPDARWLKENGIDLTVSQAFPAAVPPPGDRRSDEIYFSSLARARIVRYSDAVMDPLRGRPDIMFTPIEDVITARRREMQASGPSRARQIYNYLQHYYFDSAGERGQQRAAPLLQLLEAKGAGSPSPDDPAPEATQALGEGRSTPPRTGNPRAEER